MSAKHTCDGRIPTGFFGSVRCGKTAAHEHEGRWYCKTHHPPTKEAKRKAKHDAWLKKWNEDRARNEAVLLERAEQKRRADCFPELLEALICLRGACAADGWLLDPKHIEHMNDARAAIAKATGEQA